MLTEYPDNVIGQLQHWPWTTLQWWCRKNANTSDHAHNAAITMLQMMWYASYQEPFVTLHCETVTTAQYCSSASIILFVLPLLQSAVVSAHTDTLFSAATETLLLFWVQLNEGRCSGEAAFTTLSMMEEKGEKVSSSFLFPTWTSHMTETSFEEQTSS